MTYRVVSALIADFSVKKPKTAIQETSKENGKENGKETEESLKRLNNFAASIKLYYCNFKNKNVSFDNVIFENGKRARQSKIQCPICNKVYKVLYVTCWKLSNIYKHLKKHSNSDEFDIETSMEDQENDKETSNENVDENSQENSTILNLLREVLTDGQDAVVPKSAM